MIKQKQILLVFCLVCFSLNARAEERLPIELIKLPEGFKIEVFADNLPNARSMTQGDKGTIFVGTRAGKEVYALVDSDKDNKADQMYVVARDLWSPNGVAFKDGDLYIAEINRVTVLRDIENNLKNPPIPVVINNTFPKETHHGWKYIKFGPDGKLYVPVGAPCNVCERDDIRFATLMRMDSDGSNLEVYAQGIRNTVGFDWDPKTGELWFTDNGRDNLGDNIPPDELNHASQLGMHFGFPYCHGKNISDPQFGKKYSCANFNPPVQELGPHVAALGMNFYEGTMFPSQYHNQIFIAEHGSWNRGSKIGYRVSVVTIDNGKAASYTTFAEGWKQGEKVWGRPVDVFGLPDGSILVSDDHAGAVYRIFYEAK